MNNPANRIQLSVGPNDGEFKFSPENASGRLGAGGSDVSPELRWTPSDDLDVKSYALTVYDPDAPLEGGYWHWAVYDIPATCTSLAVNAGAEASTIDVAGSRSPQAVNSAGFPGYVGVAPPVGHGPHRYFFQIHALDVPKLDVPDHGDITMLAFFISEHEIAKGQLVATYERTEE